MAAVLIASVPPVMLKSASNPEGLPIEVFDSIRKGVSADRSQFYKGSAVSFYGANKGTKVSQGLLDQFWLWGMQSGLLNAYESIPAFSETDLTAELKRITVPTLVLHREADQIVPIKDSGYKTAKLIPGAKEIYYPGAPHGLTATHQDQVNADLLEFVADHTKSFKQPDPSPAADGLYGHLDDFWLAVTTFAREAR
jgi:non-heme chloroperoxidase